jgi:hypothetical protein
MKNDPLQNRKKSNGFPDFWKKQKDACLKKGKLA